MTRRRRENAAAFGGLAHPLRHPLRLPHPLRFSKGGGNLVSNAGDFPQGKAGPLRFSGEIHDLPALLLVQPLEFKPAPRLGRILYDGYGTPFSGGWPGL